MATTAQGSVRALRPDGRLVATLTQFLGRLSPDDFLKVGKSAIYAHEW
jgi:hypothetical protein